MEGLDGATLATVRAYAAQSPRSIADDQIIKLVDEIFRQREQITKLNAYGSAEIRRLTHQRNNAVRCLEALRTGSTLEHVLEAFPEFYRLRDLAYANTEKQHGRA